MPNDDALPPLIPGPHARCDGPIFSRRGRLASRGLEAVVEAKRDDDRGRATPRTRTRGQRRAGGGGRGGVDRGLIPGNR